MMLNVLDSSEVYPSKSLSSSREKRGAGLCQLSLGLIIIARRNNLSLNFDVASIKLKCLLVDRLLDSHAN